MKQDRPSSYRLPQIPAATEDLSVTLEIHVPSSDPVVFYQFADEPTKIPQAAVVPVARGYQDWYAREGPLANAYRSIACPPGKRKPDRTETHLPLANLLHG